MKMQKAINILSLAIALFLVSCKTGQKAQKGTHGDPNNLATRLSSFKQMQFDKNYFEGISEKMAGNYQNALTDFQEAVKVDGGSAAAYYEIANASVQLGKIAEAEKAAEKSVSLDKDDNKWYILQLTDIYRFEKKWPQAAALYEKLVKIEPNDPENYFRLAAVYEAENKTSDAIKAYDKIESDFGLSEEVALQKHRLYVGQSKYDKAIDEVNKLIASDPNNTKYYQILAETYMKAGNEKKAMEVYDQLVQKSPDNGDIQLALADFYYKKGDHQKSFDLLKKAFANKSLSIDNKIGILYNDYLMQPTLSENDKKDAYELTEIMVNAHPADAKGHAIYGDFLYQDKKYDEARIQYRKSLETKKNIFAVWQQLLLADAELKDYKSLSDESEKALDYFPNQPIVYFMDGISNIQLKNYKKAASVLESGLNQTIENPALEVEFYNNLAEAYYRMNEYAKSDSYFDKALEKDPNNIQALNNYAYYLSVRNEKLDLAESMSKKTLDKEPENASYLDTYGWILYKKGKYEEAAKYIKQSLDKEKQSAEVNEHYGDVEFKLGMVDIAIEYWKNAKQYGSESPNLDKKIANHKIIE
jgi:tetratricopeptide (TPR) repeat protein